MKRIKAEPIARFRVYAWKSVLYFLVIVWQHKKDMLDYRVSMGLPRLRDCEAHTISYGVTRISPDGRRRKRPIVGEIHFHKARLGTEAITHEALHATASLLRRLNFDFADLNKEGIEGTLSGGSRVMNKEEIVAGINGKMARAIVEGLYERKLL
jgi:hypothetical protein